MLKSYNKITLLDEKLAHTFEKCHNMITMHSKWLHLHKETHRGPFKVCNSRISKIDWVLFQQA